MSYTDFLTKLDSLQYLIENENTGTAEELAKKMKLSRRSLFYYFDVLKDRGFNIKFCRHRKTYFFDK